jgi:hypothetical protein
LGGFASAAGSQRSVLSLLRPAAHDEPDPQLLVSGEPTLAALLKAPLAAHSDSNGPWND